MLVPATEPGCNLLWCRIESLEHLEPGAHNILEPAPGHRNAVAPPTNAVALVPGIAFAHDGHRLGYGGGYFDRFLASFTGVSIGLAFDAQRLDTIPTEPNDIAVSIIVTESGVHRCVGERPHTHDA